MRLASFGYVLAFSLDYRLVTMCQPEFKAPNWSHCFECIRHCFGCIPMLSIRCFLIERLGEMSGSEMAMTDKLRLTRPLLSDVPPWEGVGVWGGFREAHRGA